MKVPTNFAESNAAITKIKEFAHSKVCMPSKATLVVVCSKKTNEFAFEDSDHCATTVARIVRQVITCTHRLAISLIHIKIIRVADLKVQETRAESIFLGVVSDPDADIKTVE